MPTTPTMPKERIIPKRVLSILQGNPALFADHELTTVDLLNELKELRKEVQELKSKFELFAGDHVFINGKLVQLKDMKCL